MASRAAPPTLLAIGVISAPQFLERRLALRSSWMLSPNVGPSRVVEVRFVVRMEEAPAALAEALRAENDTFSGDVLGVSVAWNASRVKGPLLSLAAWLRFAARRLRHIQFIAKADDDLYIHTRDLEHLLRSLHAAAPAPSRLYLGSMSWFHWLPAIFERSGWGGTFFQSWTAGERCRNRTAACLGPFPFAAGFLIVLSRGLAGELASSETMADDVRRLKAARGLQQNDGRRAWKVLEDIWLGSLLYRDPPKGGPVRFVNMPEGLVVDKWGLRVTPTAVLVHLKHRLLERFLAVHNYSHGAEHCRARLHLNCSTRGCLGFLYPWLQDGPSPLRQTLQHSPPLPFRRGEFPILDAAFASPFCAGGSQAGASFCHLEASAPETCPCVGVACHQEVDIRERAEAPQLRRRKERLLQRAAAFGGGRAIMQRLLEGDAAQSRSGGGEG